MSLYEIRNTQKKGIGIFAKQFIEIGKEIIAIHEDQFITSDIVPDFYEFFQLLYNPMVCQKILYAYFLAALEIINPNHRQEHNHIIKYINQLPKNIHGLINWNENQLKKLKNTKLQEQIAQKRQNLKNSFSIIKQSVQKVWEKPQQKCQYRLFTKRSELQKIQFNSVVKFYSHIESRGVFYISQRDLSEEIGAFVPIIDKINHSDDPNCTVQIKSNIVLKSIKNIFKGQELVVSYGKFSIEHFLEYYGFLPQQGIQSPQSQKFRQNLAKLYTQKLQTQVITKYQKNIKNAITQPEKYNNSPSQQKFII